jgi:hypothetical protein
MIKTGFVFRLEGFLWLFLGFFIFILAVLFAVASKAINDFFINNLHVIAQIFGPWLNNIPQTGINIQVVCGMITGLFSLFIGAGLVSLKPWARTVGILYNFTLALCVVFITIITYSRLITPGLLTSPIPKSIPVIIAIFGILIALGLAGLGFLLSTHSAMEAFFGYSPENVVQTPLKCPTCGGVLDVEKALCPHCDKDLSLSGLIPTRARLVSIQTGKEYSISTHRTTRIGRDTPGFEILLDDKSVSGEHAMIEYTDGHFYLHALRDTNGTYLNDMSHRIRDCEIHSDDLLAFGRAQFHFLVE